MEFTAERPRKGSGGAKKDDFIRLKDKESIVGIFFGNPIDFESHWIGDRSETCSGDDCDICAEGREPTFKFRINFITRINGALESKIFESSGETYEGLKVLHKKYDLEKYTVEITRNGSGTKTKYIIMPLPDGKIGEAVWSKLKEVPLKNLEPYRKPKAASVEDAKEIFGEGTTEVEDTFGIGKDELNF